MQALQDVTVDFAPGEIHAVLGENGAGKSTLMNLLSGFLAPDTGTIELDGKPVPAGRPQACRALGIEMIHQHFMLVPAFTVAENLAISRLGSLGGTLDMDRLNAQALQVAKELGWPLDPNARTQDLPVGAQQRLEILKALGGSSQVLIFDEPTAVLAPDEVEDLLRVLRALADRGKTVILIAHKLAEVLSVADRVTVLRRGKWIATAPRDAVDADILAEWMVGEPPQVVRRSDAADVRPGLEVRGLRVRGDRGEEAVRGLQFEVGCGEILGFGGVDGNGQVELAEALAGVRPFAGEFSWKGGPFVRNEVRVAYIPQDRRRDGLALPMSVQENMLLGGVPEPLRFGPFLRLGPIRTWSARLIEKFGIKVEGPEAPVSGLSGGNQQKVVVSRNLDVPPDLLIAVNPTRGLDFRATEFVHAQILAARAAGAAVVLISTDLDELQGLADRLVFLSRGVLAEALLGDAP